MAKYCAYCGSPLAENAAFCSHCGKAVPAVRQPEPQRTSAGWQVREPQLQRVQPAPQKKKKRGGFFIFLLAAALLVTAYTGFVKPGFFLPKETDPASLINRVQVTVPNPTGPEAIVSLEAGIALQYYIEARMLLEKLSAYDTGKMDAEAFRQLVDDTVTAFENADKISESLARSVDLWMETDDNRDKPTIKVLQTAGADAGTSFPDLFIKKAYARDKSAAEMTAQEIVDVFDKAKNGQKIRTLATLLGTDAKHAYAQLKIAQATLEGIEANKIAEQATTCIRVAKTLKTAGTVAGLVVAAAPVATGAVATMATGELIATGGGIVMGAVNSGLEITSTGATLYYGTDENPITKKADEIAESDSMKTANLVVGIAGLGYNIKNMVTKANELLDNADKFDDLEQLLSSLSQNGGKEGTDLFGILSFGLSNFDPHEGTLMGISVDPHLNGLKINISDTKIGTSDAQKEAMREVLKDGGLSGKEAEKAVEQGVELLESGKKPEGTAPDPAADLPANSVEQKLKENELIAPGSSYVDLDDLINELETYMEALAAFEARTAASTEASTEASTPAASSTASPPSETAEAGLSGLGWIEPYSYFRVEEIYDLYPLLSQYRPAAIRVKPIVYASYGQVKTTNEESFVIDLKDGAVSVYETTFYEGNSMETAWARHEFRITFTGHPERRDMMLATIDYDQYRTKDGSVASSLHDDTESLTYSDSYRSFINDPKAFALFAYSISFKILFVIEEVYFP